MSRVDLFTPVHKGIRGALFELAAAVARLELTSNRAIDHVVAEVERVLGYLDEHAAHENDHSFVALRRLDPALADELDRDHQSLDIVQREVERLADALALADLAGRERAAFELAVVVHQLIALQLIHMNREETEANAVLWAGLGDDALVELRTRLVSTIPADRYAEWMELVRAHSSPAVGHLVETARVG